MPDSSKAKARRRAAIVRDVEDLRKLQEYGDQRAEEAVNNALINLPNGYRKIAESDDMYTRTRVSGFYDGKGHYYFKVKDDDVERSFGPFNKRNLQTLTDVLKDVLSSGSHPFIE